MLSSASSSSFQQRCTNLHSKLIRHNSKNNKAAKLTLLPLLFLNYSTIQIKAMSTTTTSCKPAALIFLHGLGDSPAGWSSLEDQLPSIEPSLSQLKYIFPPAPTISISINGGMKMPGWFDLYDWPIGIGIKDDHDGLSKAVDVVEECVDKLIKESNGLLTRDRIAVGGFSQGGAVALRSAYHSGKGPYGACVSLSGWITFSKVNENEEANVKDIPLFIGHGSYDDKVLFEQQNHAEITLNGEGVKDIESKSYNMGHSSHPQEMVDVAKFLKKVFFEAEG